MLARCLLLLALALTPTASGLAVDLAAPDAVPREPVPVAADVTVREAEDPIEVKAWLGGEGWQASRTWNGTAFQRSDRYALTATPDDQGTWSGRVWVKANPSSANADRWQASDERQLGVRVRAGGERASATADVDELSAGNRSWASAEPGRPIAIRQAGDRVSLLGSPEGRQAIAVPAPGEQLAVCGPAGCQPDPAWRVVRVGAEDVVLEPAGGTDPGVLVKDGQACPLPPPSGEEPRRLSWPNRTDRGGCADAGRDPFAARHVHRGRVLAEAPDRPGGGEVVRGDGGWAPWRLPAGTEPEPVETLPVEGQARVFATAEEGLDVLARVLEEARERVTVASYLLTSEPATELIARTADRGVDVHLWLEPDPVGGQPEETARRVERLQAHGVQVHEAAGPSQAGLQHAKIVVVDSTLVLVLTENLTEHGLPRGGEANMGLGVGLVNASLAGAVEGLFRQPGEPRAIAIDGWRPIHAPVTLLHAPENAWREEGVPAWLAETDGPVAGAVLRANPRWGSQANAWLDSLVDHSRTAPVDVTLSGAPEGAARSNREAIAHLHAHPEAGELSAELSDPRRGTLHAKTIVTPEAVLVGSSNWGLGGVLLNREVNVIVHDPELADRAWAIVDDWDEPPLTTSLAETASQIPASLVPVGLALAGAALLNRRAGGARWRRR